VVNKVEVVFAGASKDGCAYRNALQNNEMKKRERNEKVNLRITTSMLLVNKIGQSIARLKAQRLLDSIIGSYSENISHPEPKSASAVIITKALQLLVKESSFGKLR
jgi:hypothetical protein